MESFASAEETPMGMEAGADLARADSILRTERPEVTSGAPRAIEQIATEELVSRAQAGDRDAYAMIFHRFHNEVYRFATRRVGDPVSGQDVAAETFADAFASMNRFRWKGVPFEAWLYTIARRRVADSLRARARRAETPMEESSIDDASGLIADRMHVRALIGSLPETERDVIELRFMEDLDVEQTALRLGKQPGAVRVAQHRALARLRAQMENADG